VSKRLYVYAIIDAPVPLDDLAPAPASALMLVAGPSCWSVVTWLDRIPEPTPDSLAAQDAIVRALASRAEALLPLRFGTSFENETAFQTRLAEIDADRLRDALARVRGCAQMTLRAFRSTAAATSAASPVATSSAAAASSGPGTSYLTQRAAALKAAPTYLQPLREQLAPIVREEIAEASTHAPLIETAFHLIARGDADRYTAIASAWTPRADIILRVSGPSPAYAFAKDALS
jgi:hypothetical protein